MDFRMFLHNLIIERNREIVKMREITRIYLPYSVGSKRKEIAFSNQEVIFVVFSIVILS